MTANSAPDAPADAVPVIQVVSGTPSPEELTALVVVLIAAAGDGASGIPDRSSSRWAAPPGRMRPAVGHGSGVWRTSSFPR